MSEVIEYRMLVLRGLLIENIISPRQGGFRAWSVKDLFWTAGIYNKITIYPKHVFIGVDLLAGLFTVRICRQDGLPLFVRRDIASEDEAVRVRNEAWDAVLAALRQYVYTD